MNYIKTYLGHIIGMKQKKVRYLPASMMRSTGSFPMIHCHSSTLHPGCIGDPSHDPCHFFEGFPNHISALHPLWRLVAFAERCQQESKLWVSETCFFRLPAHRTCLPFLWRFKKNHQSEVQACRGCQNSRRVFKVAKGDRPKETSIRAIKWSLEKKVLKDWKIEINGESGREAGSPEIRKLLDSNFEQRILQSVSYFISWLFYLKNGYI